jgi:hypothetical protein
MVSLGFWFIGMFMLREILRKKMNNRLHVWMTTFMIAFSNLGIFLATDGRFYAILFCLAVAMMLVYTHRNGLKPIVYFGVLLVIQLAGLLTSVNFILVQSIFGAAILLLLRLNHFPAEKKLNWLSLLACLLSASIYFQFFRIEYFHTFFTTNLFSDKPFNRELFNEFVSIPFRWIMMPHIPSLSDLWDVAVFCVAVALLLFLKPAGFITSFKELFQTNKVITIMAVLVCAFLLIQLGALGITGFPLWPGRYYTTVFFLVAVILSVTLLSLTDARLLGILMISFCLRLSMVEFPKIDYRKTEMDKLSIEQLGWLHQNKPIIFVETPTDYSVFSVMGNMYTGNPMLKNKLILKYNEEDIDRARYFLMLKQFNYPLTMTQTIDSSALVISPSVLRP